MFNQGRIEPPKAARGHATYIDGKMLSVTKYKVGRGNLERDTFFSFFLHDKER